MYILVGRLLSHQLGFFPVVSSSKTSYISLPVSLGARHNQEYSEDKRGRKIKLIKPQKDKARQEEQMKESIVIVQEKLVVGYWDLIPMLLGLNFRLPRT